MVRRKSTATRNSSASDVSKPKSPRKRTAKQKTKMLMREIKRLQSTSNLLISKAAFSRVVRETLQMFGSRDYRLSASAIEALQEAMEMYTVNFFEDSYLVTIHTGRVTLMAKDMQLCRRLRGTEDVINK